MSTNLDALSSICLQRFFWSVLLFNCQRTFTLGALTPNVPCGCYEQSLSYIIEDVRTLKKTHVDKQAKQKREVTPRGAPILFSTYIEHIPKGMERQLKKHSI